MELNFTPRTIKEIEDVKKRPIQDIVGEFSFNNVILFVQKGLKIDENEALNVIEKELEGGIDTMEIWLNILDNLIAKGFLPKALNTAEIRAKLKEMKL